jgi:uncharacterized protein YprB with RNaseH-like and TPR domain
MALWRNKETKMKEPKCTHRHTIRTHPNCFKKSLVKNDSWWNDKRIGYLDIEVTDLRADWGFMLSWCLKEKGKKNIAFGVVEKKEVFEYNFDRRIVEELVTAMAPYDVMVTYFGKPFDMKYIRSRALFWGIQFPSYGDLFHWDLYYHVKKNFRLGNNRLATVTNYLGIVGKTPLDPAIWMKARYGDRKALEYVVEHNKNDVIILEKLHDRIGDFSKWIKTSI